MATASHGMTRAGSPSGEGMVTGIYFSRARSNICRARFFPNTRCWVLPCGSVAVAWIRGFVPAWQHQPVQNRA